MKTQLCWSGAARRRWGETRCLLSIWNVDITDLAPITSLPRQWPLIPAAPAVRADDYYFIVGPESE